MDILYLREEEIAELVTVPDAIDVLEQVFRDQATGGAINNPRNRLKMPGTTLHLMPGAIPGYFGYKTYTSSAAGVQFFFFLFSEKTDLLAMMQANTLGQIRTGAASGLATRLMATAEASEAVLFGAGWQAQTQLLAMDAVRNLKRVWIANRDAKRREEFIQKMQPQVKAKLEAAATPEAAVAASQIVTTITSTREPVVLGKWLQAGTHINAAGGNLLLRREVDDDAVMRSTRVVVDSIEQAKLEAGEFVGVIESGRRHWDDFIEMRDVVAGYKPGRTNTREITLFKSLGLAIEDVAIGKLIYERAVKQGVGSRLKV
jgi:ornithine cyclodeaminase/alanine dehydrogenase-like protein (mu-crystallin family)